MRTTDPACMAATGLAANRPVIMVTTTTAQTMATGREIRFVGLLRVIVNLLTSLWHTGFPPAE
jgi:hypothetical protein